MQAGRVQKKKNRVKGKHAKGPDGKPLCGVEAKKAHFSKAPSCAGCQAALEAAASKATQTAEASRTDKEARHAAKAATWAFAPCPICEVSVPEHRLDRHMRKIHSGTDRQTPPD
ncbi:MAG: hypothetical protein JKY65_27170 [Planctomycetes bacterium]|nr:hypothetical protein [Planctomycetota bacterium]